MDELERWLLPLGLAHLAPVLRAHDIDLEILPELTEADLEKLGVSLGHRKKLLKSAASLPQLTLSSSSKAAPESTQPLSASAERRQLTVMFCDLVDSTALAAKIDPEDLREVIGAYQRCIAETVRRFDGYIARYMGDGALVYFGYPQAHEEDAERAVRAGLALIEAVGKLPAPEPLRLRIGIATGLVVVGDLVGSGEAQERVVVGETPNLAARLQATAGPNTIVVGPTTHQLLGNLFEYRNLGGVEVKGFTRPVQAYEVLRSSAAESRFEAFHAAALTPFIGREEEIELLLRRWAQAKEGEGRVVLLSGEPGIGKSRLAQTLQERIENEPYIRLRYSCSPFFQDSALHPTIARLEYAAGFGREDTADERLRKLEALLVSTTAPDEDLALIADLLSLPTSQGDPSLDFSAQRRKEKTFEALLRQVEVLSRQQPVLMIYEDVHWIDASSQELLELLIERVQRLRVLLLITFRPEFKPPWTGLPHVTMQLLNRLHPREGMSLVRQVAGNKRLPDEIVDEVVARTDGVPLFVEELTKAVLEVGAGAAAARDLVALAPPPSSMVPATLHASLMARLDRLAPAAKEIAQIGAAIGREFSYALLSAVWRRSDAELRSALEQLVEAGLAFSRGSLPQTIYLFKHALVQDAAYASLLRNPRKELHARITRAIEEHFPEIVEQRPELLARHCTEAGLIHEAISYWSRAGRQSLARAAAIEAAAQLRKGLDLLPELAEGPERWRHELDLRSALGASLAASMGNAAEETGEAYRRARTLCELLDDTTALVPVLSGLTTYHQTRAEYASMREIADELLRLGEQQSDTAGLLVGHRSTGLCLHQLGEFASAHEHFEKVLKLYVPEAHRSLASIAAYDMRAVALAYLPWELLILGYPEQARAAGVQALSWSRNLRHAHNLAFSLTYAALLNLLLRAESAAEVVLDELILLADEHRFPVWLAQAKIMRGYVLAARGEAADGIALGRQGLAERSATGSTWNETYYVALLANSYGSAGQVEVALDLLTGALETAARTGERWFEAEIHRHIGEWLVAQAQQAEAEERFQLALVVAREQRARLWELRAATRLARLWSNQNKRSDARNLIAPIYRWFTEGSDTPDLTEAKALLEDARE